MENLTPHTIALLYTLLYMASATASKDVVIIVYFINTIINRFRGYQIYAMLTYYSPISHMSYLSINNVVSVRKIGKYCA